MRMRTLSVVLVTIACAIVASFFYLSVSGLSAVEMSWGESIKRNEEFLTIEGQTIAQADLEKIAGLKRLRYLELKDCNVAECRLPELTFASKKLYHLILAGTKGLWDTSFLSRLQARYLDLSGCESVTTLDDLNWDKLDDLCVDGTGITDLSFVRDSQLHRLSFAHTEVSDLSPLSAVDELWEVDGSSSKVTSLDSLASLRWLYELRFDDCPITSPKKAFASEYLRELSLENTKVRDLSSFSRCTSLDLLDLGGCGRVTDLSWLAKETRETLTTLNVAHTGLDASDLSWLSSCTQMKRLTLDGIELDGLGMCERMRELEALSAVGCGLTGISGVQECTGLETLLLGFNQLTSLDGLPRSDAEWPRLELDLSHNQLKTASGIKSGSYRLIMLQGNAPDIWSTVPAGVDAYQAVLSWYEGLGDDRLPSKGRFTRIYLLDCPPDEEGSGGDYFWWYGVERVSEEELLDLLANNGLAFSLFGDYRWYVAYASEHLVHDKG